MRWNYLSIPEFQRLYRCSLGMDTHVYTTSYNESNYLSMLGSKLNYVSKRGSKYNLGDSELDIFEK